MMAAASGRRQVVTGRWSDIAGRTRATAGRLLAASPLGELNAGIRMEPSYLIVGGKRCGTTTLQDYLSRHPQILPVRSGKGTHYFDENYAKGERWFRAHFPAQVTQRRVCRSVGALVITGEASPYYCFHPRSFERIAEVLPDVRLIFILRDPVERAYSHFTYERRRGFETLSVHRALDAETDRLAGEEDRLRVDDSYVSFAHRHWSYASRGRYVEQLRRALLHFPTDQILILEFDKLFSGSQAEFRRVTEFLGIGPVRLGAMPRLSQGDGKQVPEGVRRRLTKHYRVANAMLAEEFGVDFC